MKEFEKLGLSQPLVENIEELGFVTPTKIQTQAIPKLLEDNTDLVGLAQTGTGKTAAFGLPLIDLVDDTIFQTQALVLAPTRELCLQITKELFAVCQSFKKIKNSGCLWWDGYCSANTRSEKRSTHYCGNARPFKRFNSKKSG